MNLSPAETALIDIIRDRASPVFTMSITSVEGSVVVIMAIPGDGVNVGTGASFEAAFFALCGREMPALFKPTKAQH